MEVGVKEKNQKAEKFQKLQKKVGLRRKLVEPLFEDDLAGVVSGGETSGCCNETKVVP